MMSARMVRTYPVLAFATTHDALAAESLLGDLGIHVTPIPAPKTLGSICGIALRLDPSDVSRAVELLERAQISVAGRTEIEDV